MSTVFLLVQVLKTYLLLFYPLFFVNSSYSVHEVHKFIHIKHFGNKLHLGMLQTDYVTKGIQFPQARPAFTICFCTLSFSTHLAMGFSLDTLFHNMKLQRCKKISMTLA